MKRPDPHNRRVHEDLALFREALNFTAAESGFSARLVEKDYYCTVVLAHFAEATEGQCIFKGGTCLAKVHVGFHRLSEDLDFAIPTPADTKRSRRRKMTERLKRAFEAAPGALAGMRTHAALVGANDSAQYIGTLSYVSAASGEEETINIEVALREPLLIDPMPIGARTMLLDPISGGPMVQPIAVPCIDRREAFAEKFRAAATRRDVAIRDFYDLEHASRMRIIDLMDAGLLALIRTKLAVPGNDPLNLTERRLTELRAQLESRLRPVLRQSDYNAFDLDRAFALVVGAAERLK